MKHCEKNPRKLGPRTMFNLGFLLVEYILQVKIQNIDI